MSHPKQPTSEGLNRPSLGVKSEKDKAMYSHSLSLINGGARKNVSEDISCSCISQETWRENEQFRVQMVDKAYSLHRWELYGEARESK